MTKKQRSILFLLVALLFVITSPIVTLYSQGYRFDFREKKITQSGAFYFKVSPKNVQIEINNQKRKKTDILFGTAYLDNLLPRTYQVTISKEGYHSWQKKLEVKEKEVTEAKNIILFPLKVSFSALSDKVIDFYFSPDNKNLFTIEKNKEEWEIKSYDLKNNIKRHLLSAKNLLLKEGEFSNLEFSPDSKKIILKVKKGEKEQFFLVNLEEDPTSSLFLSQLNFLDEKVDKISFSPKNNRELFFLKEGKLIKTNLDDKKISSPLLDNILTFYLDKEDIYYLDKDGFVYRDGLSSLTKKEKINLTNFPVRKEKNYEINLLNNFLFLKEGKGIYLFEDQSNSFEKFFEENRGIKISPNFKKVVYWSDYEIWIFFLEVQEEQPRKNAKEHLFLARFSEPIQEVFWLNSDYLIFRVGKEIKIAETDDRDKINIINFSQTTGEKFFFNQDNKKIYLLEGDKILVSERIF
jgi:hypothetical protein